MKKSILILAIVLTLCMSVSVLSYSTMTLRPNGNGNYTQWTAVGCSASSKWMCVDEAIANNSDYIYAKTLDYKQTFLFQDTGLVNKSVYSLTLKYYAIRYNSTNNKMAPIVRLGGTFWGGAAWITTSSWATYSYTWLTNPSTGAQWSLADIDALDAGIRTGWVNQPGAIVSQVYAVIDYGNKSNSCSDSDGGLVYTVQGNVSGYYYDTSYLNTDFCANNTILIEYYCSGVRAYNVTYNCASTGNGTTTRCLTGRCI